MNNYHTFGKESVTLYIYIYIYILFPIIKTQPNKITE